MLGMEGGALEIEKGFALGIRSGSGRESFESGDTRYG